MSEKEEGVDSRVIPCGICSCNCVDSGVKIAHGCNLLNHYLPLSVLYLKMLSWVKDFLA